MAGRWRFLRLCCLAWCVCTGAAYAQDEEYTMELGGGAGAAVYGGDLGTSLSVPSAVVCGRWKTGSRMAVRFGMDFMKVSGSAGTRFLPAGGGGRFGRNVFGAGAAWEVHLLGYGSGAQYMQLSRVAPFLSLGAGVCVAGGDGGPAAAAPYLAPGLGVKYKFAPRWNLALTFEARFTATDAIDASDGAAATGADNPYGTNSPGAAFKNKDCLMPVVLTVTYDLRPKCKNCNNIRYAY